MTIDENNSKCLIIGHRGFLKAPERLVACGTKKKNTGSEQVTGAVLALFRQLCGGHIAVLCEEVPKLLFNASFWYTRDVDLLQDWYQRVGYHHATHVELLVISNHRCGKIK